jgi:predicted RNA binding protein YcfA (HicA-like mRNA interferase family)
MEIIVASEEKKEEEIYAIEAKTEDGAEDEWLNMGDVRHVDAAKTLAMSFEHDGIVLTRRKGSTTIWKHRVSREVKYTVTPLREGE